MEIGERGEDVAGERDRVAASVVVAAHRQRRLATTAKQGVNGLRGHSRLVAEHEDQHVAARVDDGERRGDRRRAARAVRLVDHDVGAREVHAFTNLVRRPPERHDRLLKSALAGNADDVAQ